MLTAGALGLLTVGDGFVYLALQDRSGFATQWFPLLYVGTDVVAEVLRGRTEHALAPPHPAEEALPAHEAVAAAVRAAAEAAMGRITSEVRRALTATPASPRPSSAA
jgi:hypothetical protein